MKDKSLTSSLILMIVVGVFAGGITAYFVVQNSIPEVPERTTEDLVKEFYEVENAVSVSPHGLRKHISDGNFLIVDLRSQEEYETNHIVGAYNVPAYATPDKSDYGAVDRIVGSFKELQKQADVNAQEIVVYCYSHGCMTGRKIGKMLAENGIYVKHLNIGWQEWRYYWNLWNHDGETGVNPEEFFASGPEPGVFDGDATGGCPIGGEFGC
jgi:rhodanese-related sulfurtransferase